MLLKLQVEIILGDDLWFFSPDGVKTSPISIQPHQTHSWFSHPCSWLPVGRFAHQVLFKDLKLNIFLRYEDFKIGGMFFVIICLCCILYTITTFIRPISKTRFFFFSFSTLTLSIICLGMISLFLSLIIPSYYVQNVSLKLFSLNLHFILVSATNYISSFLVSWPFFFNIFSMNSY